MPRCSICRAEGHNKRKCSQAIKTVAKPEPEPEPKPAPDPKPEQKPKEKPQPALSQKWWVCAYCHLPIGDDHRMCIYLAYDYSVDAWKAAAIKYGQELLDAGTHPMS